MPLPILPQVDKEVDKLGLRPGTVLDFEALEGRLIGEDRIVRWLGKGVIPGGLAVDEYLRKVRG